MHRDKLKEILAAVLKVKPEEINDKSSPENIPGWDSFNGLMLVTELEKAFNVKFSIDEIIAVKDVKDIKESLRRHGVDI
mgnify:CR=1 FL=1